MAPASLVCRWQRTNWEEIFVFPFFLKVSSFPLSLPGGLVNGCFGQASWLRIVIRAWEAIHTALCASQQTKSLYTLRFPIVPFILFCDVLRFISALSNPPSTLSLYWHHLDSFLFYFCCSFPCFFQMHMVYRRLLCQVFTYQSPEVQGVFPVC